MDEHLTDPVAEHGADPTGGSAFQRAWEQTSVPAPTVGLAASQSLHQRALGRFSRGSHQITAALGQFVKAEGLAFQDKAGHWFAVAAGGFCAADLAVHKTVFSLGATAVGYCAMAFYYGGPADPAATGPGSAERDNDDEGRDGRFALEDFTGPRPALPQHSGSDAPAADAARRAFVITATGDGTSIVREISGEDVPADDPARQELAPVQLLQVAEQQLRDALNAAQVRLPVNTVAGGFTPTGQRWVVSLNGGLTVEDVTAKLANLEAAWKIPYGGAVFASTNPGGSKDQVVLVRVEHDPLDVVRTARRIAYGAVGIADRVLIGQFENDTPDLMSLLRRNVGIIAANRSGKSTLVWLILLHLTACQDAVYWLIDLQSSAALRTWTKTAGRTAWTLEDAKRLIKAAFEFAQYRARQLGDNAEAFIDADGDPGDLDVNHRPTPHSPALVLLIEEGSMLAEDKEAIEDLLLLLRTGPKGAVTVVYINQRDAQEATGSSAIRKEFGEKIMMRCEEGDVDRFLGKALRTAGFAANLIRLQGVYYRLNTIDGPLNPSPQRARTVWPEPTMVRDAIREALQHGRPRFRVEETRHVSVAMQSETFPEALAAVVWNLQQAGRNRVGIDTLRTWLLSRDPQAWPAAVVDRELREMGLEPGSIKDSDGSGMRGFYFTQLNAALNPPAPTGEND